MNQETEKSPQELVVELWKKRNINEVILTFDCGGDSMGNMDWEVFTAKGKYDGKDRTEITDFFHDEVFRKVEFYECSDGEYMGESGTVTITLNDEDDFDYDKSATSEYNTTEQEVLEVELNVDEEEFLKNYVSNINGGEGSYIFNYKKDFILTEELEELVDDLGERIDQESIDLEFDVDGEWNEWYSFSTDLEDSVSTELTIVNHKLRISVNKTFYTYEESN